MSRELEPGHGVSFDDATDPLKLIANRKALVAQVSITHPTTPALISVVGTNDPDLYPVTYAANYISVLNHYGAALNADGAFTILADGRVQVNYAGYVQVTGFADVSHSAQNSTVGASFTIERSAVVNLSPRAVHALLPNSGNIGNICGAGTLLAEVGDIIGVALASDNSGDISIRSSSLVFDWKGL